MKEIEEMNTAVTKKNIKATKSKKQEKNTQEKNRQEKKNKQEKIKQEKKKQEKKIITVEEIKESVRFYQYIFIFVFTTFNFKKLTNGFFFILQIVF